MPRILDVWREHSANFEAYSKRGKYLQLLDLVRAKLSGYNYIDYYVIPLHTRSSNKKLISNKSYSHFVQHLNPKYSGAVPFDKWVQSCFWKATGLPHAATHGFLKKNLLQYKDYIGEITIEKLDDFFRNCPAPVALKPTDGANGLGFDVLEGYDSNAKVVSFKRGGKIPIAEVKSRLFPSNDGFAGYLIQDLILQHPELAEFFPRAVNSLRVVTHMDENSRVTVDCSLMKFGAGESITDNDNSDRVFTFMDNDTGVLGKAFTSKTCLDPIDFHPFSNKQISGYTLPFWRESLELAKTAHTYLPYPRHVGWDIAITAQGPLIIEMNSFLAISMYQKDGNDILTSTSFGRAFERFSGNSGN